MGRHCDHTHAGGMLRLGHGVRRAVTHLWWWRTRGMWLQLVLLTGCFLLVLVVRSARVQVPGLSPIGANLPIAALGPLPLVEVMAIRMGATAQQEVTAVRRMWRHDLTAFALIAAISAALGALMIPLVGGVGLETARTLVGLGALGVLASRLAGRRVGAAAPVLHLFISLAAGGPESWWQFPLAGAHSMGATLLVGVLCLALALSQVSQYVRAHGGDA